VEVTVNAQDGPGPRVHVGPGPLPEVERAVRAGGCVPVAGAGEATAVVWFGREPRALLACLHPDVGWVQLPDAGVERWLAAGVLDGHRVVTSARGVYGRQVAEHALALVLACTRRLGAAARAAAWAPEPVRGFALEDRVVTVVGAGDIGGSLLRMLGPLGCRRVAVTRRGLPVPGADVTLDAGRLHEALAGADVVVVAAPSTSRTAGMLGAEEFARMRPGAYVVNVARGDLVVTGALLAALDSGRLAGAALDVTDPEPLPEGHPLWTHPAVLITPHVANPPAAKRASFARRVEDNCRRYARGQPLLGVVDPDAGY
jgi:phosphoglycerate dehydrogenase-like enzyme